MTGHYLLFVGVKRHKCVSHSFGGRWGLEQDQLTHNTQKHAPFPPIPPAFSSSLGVAIWHGLLLTELANIAALVSRHFERPRMLSVNLGAIHSKFFGCVDEMRRNDRRAADSETLLRWQSHLAVPRTRGAAIRVGLDVDAEQVPQRLIFTRVLDRWERFHYRE